MLRVWFVLGAVGMPGGFGAGSAESERSSCCVKERWKGNKAGSSGAS